MFLISAGITNLFHASLVPSIYYKPVIFPVETVSASQLCIEYVLPVQNTWTQCNGSGSALCISFVNICDSGFCISPPPPPRENIGILMKISRSCDMDNTWQIWSLHNIMYMSADCNLSYVKERLLFVGIFCYLLSFWRFVRCIIWCIFVSTAICVP